VRRGPISQSAYQLPSCKPSANHFSLPRATTNETVKTHQQLQATNAFVRSNNSAVSLERRNARATPRRHCRQPWWMLDAFDVMLYSIVLATLMRAFAMSRTTAGLLNALTLIASAWAPALRNVGRPLRAPPHAHASISLLRIHLCLRPLHQHLHARNLRFLLGLAWAANGTPRSAGRRILASAWRAALSASCRAAGPSATRSPPW